MILLVPKDRVIWWEYFVPVPWSWWNDIIMHRAHVLCHLGKHDWTLYHMSPRFQQAFPDMAVIHRSCERCHKTQETHDGRKWI